VANPFRRNRERERALERELRYHLDRRVSDLTASGLSEPEARRRASVELGGMTQIKEGVRETWGPPWRRIPARYASQFAQDIRYAIRGLWRTKGFTIAVVSMLAVGLGLVAGCYAALNGIFFRGWPVPDSARVFTVHASRASQPAEGNIPDGITFRLYQHIRRHARTTDYVAAEGESLNLRLEGEGEDQTVRVEATFVSDNFLQALRIPLELGTGLHPADAADGQQIVISHRLWQRRFAGDPGVIGQTVWLDGLPATVVGVTSRSLTALGRFSLEVVGEMSAAAAFNATGGNQLSAADESACCVALIGRLRTGWTRTQAAEELKTLSAHHRHAAGEPALAISLAGTAAADTVWRGDAGDELAGLALAGAGFTLVLLLTSANVGNLFLARSLRREGEIGVRLALGASRLRVVRQLVTEGLVLAAVAGTGAFLVPLAVQRVLRLIGQDLESAIVAPDWRVAAFTGVAVVTVCLLVSLAPALQVTRLVWRGGAAVIAGRPGRTRGVLLAVQIATAAALVLSATLIARGIHHASRGPTDIARDTTTLAIVRPPAGQSYDRPRETAIRAALTGAATQSRAPVGLAEVFGDARNVSLGVGAHVVSVPGSEVRHSVRSAPMTAAGFRVLGIGLVEGRWPSEDPSAAEAVINQRLRQLLWSDGRAIGRILTLSDRPYTVVGVVRDVRLTSVYGIEPTVHIAPSIGIPALVVRNGDMSAAAIRSTVAAIDPALTVTVVPFAQSFTRALQEAQVVAGLAGGLGIIALVIAIIGVFAVFSYLVEERRREIGIRLALGATTRQIARTLFHASRGAITGGLVAGLALSAFAAVALRRLLFGLSPADPVSYLTVAMLLGVAAFVATVVPVLRSMRTDPAEALRAE
jgi:predicted permease